MKIGFFGTPAIAGEVLEYLICSYDVVFAVTSRDKPQGRSKRICKTPVRECAEKHCLDVLQPERLRSEDTVHKIASYGADIFVVFAYGHIIPRSIFDIPRLGTLNLHPSLLPLYRGAAPVQWAVIDGQRTTGVTIQKIVEELDAGDIVRQEEIPIGPDTTTGELYDAVLPVGKRLLDEAITGLDSGTITPRPQNHLKATYCCKITRETAQIQWREDARTIHNLIRGLCPKPGAWTHFRGIELKIWRSTLPEETGLPELMPGELVRYGKRRLLAGTGSGTLEIISIQPSGKKTMDAPGFINGARLLPGERFNV